MDSQWWKLSQGTQHDFQYVDDGLLSLSILHFNSRFSLHNNSFSVSVSQILSFHLILEASLWAPTQPGSSPGQTSVLTAECLPVSWKPPLLYPIAPLTWQVPAWIDPLSCLTCSSYSIPCFRNDTIPHPVTMVGTWESSGLLANTHSYIHPLSYPVCLARAWLDLLCSLLPLTPYSSSVLTYFILYWRFLFVFSHTDLLFSQADFSFAAIAILLEFQSGHVSPAWDTM